MSRRTRARILSLMLLLGVLTGVLATPDSQTAHAQVCCESCYFMYDNCIAGTGYAPCYGDFWCCNDQADRCMQTCYWC